MVFRSPFLFFTAATATPSNGDGCCHFGIRSAFLIPHREKAKRGGEDSFFLHKAGICAADGVGGWARSGVDPAIFTRRLVNAAYDALAALPFATTPQLILERGVEATRGVKGSCTAVAALVDGSKKRLLTHLVGDCGLVFMRGGECIYRTEEQQQGFNCPFQLPSNRVSHGRAHTIDRIQQDDIVILGSDGLFDNLFTDDLVKIVNDIVPPSSLPKAGSVSAAPAITPEQCTAISQGLAEAAFKNSQNKSYRSPFAVNAAKAGYRFLGGKEDDITVVVGVLTSTDVDVKPPFSAINEVDFSSGKSRPLHKK